MQSSNWEAHSNLEAGFKFRCLAFETPYFMELSNEVKLIKISSLRMLNFEIRLFWAEYIQFILPLSKKRRLAKKNQNDLF